MILLNKNNKPEEVLSAYQSTPEDSLARTKNATKREESSEIPTIPYEKDRRKQIVIDRQIQIDRQRQTEIDNWTGNER